MPITRTVDGGVASITILGTDERNVLSPEMILDLHEALMEVDADPRLKVAILQGREDGNFSIGADPDAVAGMLAGMKDVREVLRHYMYPFSCEPPSLWVAWTTLLQRRMATPVVGAVVGDCFGLALAVLGLHTDIRIVASGSRFGFPEIREGAGSGLALVSNLSNQIPIAALNWLIETGRPIDAHEAHRYFLVNEVVPENHVRDRAREVAELIATRSSSALRVEKLTLAHLSGASYEEAVPIASELATLTRKAENVEM